MKTFRELWSSLTGHSVASKPAPAVVVYDPAAQKPHDLDDPFFDPAVQSRMAGVIAGVAAKKPDPPKD